MELLHQVQYSLTAFRLIPSTPGNHLPLQPLWVETRFGILKRVQCMSFNPFQYLHLQSSHNKEKGRSLTGRATSKRRWLLIIIVWQGKPNEQKLTDPSLLTQHPPPPSRHEEGGLVVSEQFTQVSAYSVSQLTSKVELQ